MPLRDPDAAPDSPSRPRGSYAPSYPPPAPPTTREDLLSNAGPALTPDSPELDALITGSYVRLMLTARDENIRLEATRDLNRNRGYFARAEAKAAVAGAAACAQISARPDVFARLLAGLGDLGVVRASAVDAVREAVAAADPADDLTPVTPEDA